MKVIFLDVDGELTYSNYSNSETHNIDIEKVKLLKEICSRTDAKVVISSSWRCFGGYVTRGYKKLRSILEEEGIDVLGDTPYVKTIYKENGKRTFGADDSRIPVEYGSGRGAEIQKWISENTVESFVILDDEDWCWSDYKFENNWIQPTWIGDGGLKREHVEKAVEILNK